MWAGQHTFFPMCSNVVVEIISIEFECHCMSWEVHVWTLDDDCLVSRCMWGVWSVNILSIQKCSIGSDCYRKSMMHVTFKFQYDSMILFLLFRQKKKTLGCPSLTINISLLQFLFHLTLQLFYFKCQFVLRSKLLGIWEWILLLCNFMRPYIIWKLCLSIIPSLQFWIFDSSTY
jgi:hypothetical protein